MYETFKSPAIIADAIPPVENPRWQPTNRNYYLWNYDIYRQNSNNEPTAFDHGKLVGSVSRQFQLWPTIGNGGQNRIRMYVYFRFRPAPWFSQWMSRRPTLFRRQPSTFPFSKTIMQLFTATRYVLPMMTYYYFRICPSSWKCTITVVYTLRSHFQSPTFIDITYVRFTSVLHKPTMSVLEKPDISIWPPKPEIISGNMTDNLEIPTPNSGFSMITSSVKNCDSDRLPEIARLAPKMSILPFPVVGHCRSHLATLYSGSS